ncbi:MAG: helix-hairpin-helix domain-containing protein [Clostridiales bacterium]|nr:helix-hairpin-helix domain-containing protein [Clostridiales bacterium]
MTDIIDFKRRKDQHTDVSDLKINSKIVKALVSAGVDTVGKLTDYTPEQLLDIPGIGIGYEVQIEIALAMVGLRLRNRR